MPFSHERDCCLGWLPKVGGLELAKTLKKEILKRAGISRVNTVFLGGGPVITMCVFFFNIPLIPQVAGDWTMDRHLT